MILHGCHLVVVTRNMITPTMDEDHIVESTGTGFNRKTLHREVFFMYFVLCINLYLWRGILGPFTTQIGICVPRRDQSRAAGAVGTGESLRCPIANPHLKTLLIFHLVGYVIFYSLS